MTRLISKTFLTTIIGAICAFITHILLARILSPQGYGQYSFIISLSTIFSFLAAFGFPALLNRLIAQYIDDNASQWLKALALTITAYSTALVIGALSGIVIYGGLYWANILPNYHPFMFVLGIIIIIIMAWARLSAGFFKGMHMAARSNLYENVGRDIILCAMIIGIILYYFLPYDFTKMGDFQTLSDQLHNAIPHDFSSHQALSLYVLAVMIVMPIMFLHMVYIFKYKNLTPKQHKNQREKQSLEPSPPPSILPIIKDNFWPWMTMVWPMLLVLALQILIHRTDIIMIELLSDSATTGIYALATSIAQTATLINVATFSVYNGQAARLYKNGTMDAFQQNFQKFRHFLMGGSWVSIAFVAAISPLIMMFLQDGYNQAQWIILLLLAGHGLNAFWGPSANTMMMSIHEKPLMRMTVLALISNIMLNFALIPYWGAYGAAIATIISLNLRNILAFMFIQKKVFAHG